MSLLDAIAGLAKSLLTEDLRRRLRGKHNSVRKRFVDDPLERLNLAIATLCGENYQSWYARRMDSFISQRSGEDIAKLSQFSGGIEDLDVLKDLGLKPTHRFYEFGHGQGRTAQHVISYLDEGRYFGNDASPGRVSEFLSLMEYRGLRGKNPTVWVTRTNDFSWVPEGWTFDYLWEKSVLNHMPDTDVRVWLRSIPRILHRNSIVLLTDGHLDGTEKCLRYTVKDWFRPASWYCREAEACGFKAEDVSHLLRYGIGGHAKNVSQAGDETFTYSSHLVKLTLR